jgi:hypothetical protein
MYRRSISLKTWNHHIAGRKQRLREKMELSSFRMVSRLAHCSTLKMETVSSSFTSPEFHQTTRSHPKCSLRTGKTKKNTGHDQWNPGLL